jgi:hypothetical protein
VAGEREKPDDLRGNDPIGHPLRPEQNLLAGLQDNTENHSGIDRANAGHLEETKVTFPACAGKARDTGTGSQFAFDAANGFHHQHPGKRKCFNAKGNMVKTKSRRLK